MANISKYHPGSYLKDYLEAANMTANELSARTGISERTISGIVNEKTSISFDVAYKLAQFMDSSVSLWMNLQNEYDLACRKEEELLNFQSELKLAKKTKAYLMDLKEINGAETDEQLIAIAKKVTAVASLQLLTQKESFVCWKEQHRQKNPDYYYQNFWVSMALTKARNYHNKAYDKKKLLSNLPRIRSLTVEDDETICKSLYEIFDECGISFVLLPYLTKSEIYGATKWFNKENVMLAVSDKGKREDMFWFTLFHEISHVLMEHRRVTLMQVDGVLDQEADNMAKNILIDQKDWNDFLSQNNFTKSSIINFANKIEISPAIVLGRLHKENILDYGTLDNQLIRKFHITIQD